MGINFSRRMSTIKGFDFNLLIVFELVYKYGSISRASEALNITPSAVSQSISNLKNHLGYPLFIKGGSGVIPTIVSVELHSQISAPLKKLVDYLDGVNVVKKDLIISCPEQYSFSLFPDLSMMFMAAYPERKIRHVDRYGYESKDEDVVTVRNVDVVIDIGRSSNSGIHSEFLFQDDMVLVCRKKHPRREKIHSIQSACQEAFIEFNTNNLRRNKYASYIKENFGERKFSTATSSMLLLYQIVNNTDLLAFSSRYFYERNGHLFNLSILNLDDFESPKLDVYISYKIEILQQKVFRDLIDYIKSLV